MFGISHASAANASSGALTWDDDRDPGMKLVMRPAVVPKSAPALESTPTPPPAPAAPSTPAVRSVPAAPTAHGNPLWVVPLRLLHNTRERPLFSSSRRPPPPHPAPSLSVAVAPPRPPPPKPSRPDLRLVGTIIGDRESIGVFVEDGTAKMLRLRTGEGHGGWILRGVEPRSVTLDNDNTRAVLALPAPGTDSQHAIPSPYARGTRRVHY
jgi:general secretion pathway protein N